MKTVRTISVILIIGVIAFTIFINYRNIQTTEAVDFLSREGQLVYFEATDTYQYTTVWEITTEELKALTVVSRKYGIILYTK